MAGLQPRRVQAETPETIVKCRVCGESKEARSMYGHVGRTHKLKEADYIEKYGPDASRDFYFKGRLKADPEPDAIEEDAFEDPSELPTIGGQTIEDDVTAKLNARERKFYDDYSQEVFSQIDRDMSQWPVIMSLTMDMITLTRLRKQMDAATNPTGGKKGPSAKALEAIARSTKDTEVRIRAQMSSLGISRDQKLKHKAQVRTTAFCLFSGYLDELERMTPQQALSFENEERKLMNVVKDRTQRLYLAVAPDIVETDEDDGTLSNLDVERIIEQAGIEL